MRKPRVQFQGALYHVIVRGNQRQKVFLSGDDYRQYLKMIGEKAILHSIKLYAYCLMPNHAHLLMEQEGHFSLARYMQALQTAYTKYFNKKHKKVGHVFQGRYKAFLVERDSYLLELVRYIHLNPFRGKLEDKMGEYPWSSHGQYLGKEKNGMVKVAKKEVLDMLSRTKGVKTYLKFILDGMGEGHRADFYEVGSWQVLGSEGYEARSLARIGEKGEGSLRIKLGIGDIWSRIKGREKLGKEPVGRQRVGLIEEAAWIAVECGNRSQTEVAKYFGMGQSGISEAIKRLTKKWQVHLEARKMTLRWMKGLNFVIDA